MSYDLHITKADHWVNSDSNPITEEDLARIAHFLDAYEQIPFLFQRGRLTLCGANGNIINLMIAIASPINAIIQGDDGEIYTASDSNLNSSAYRDIPQHKLPSLKIDTLEALDLGDQIWHRKFGRGTILKIIGEGLDTELTVKFADLEMPKRILLYYSPIIACKP